MSLPGFLKIVAGLSLAGLVPMAASAADLSPADALAEPPPVETAAPASIGSGWYLRADFTESYNQTPRDATPITPNDPGLPPLVGMRMGQTPGVGGGIGYRFNEWLRMDATIDQRKALDFAAYSSRSNFVTGYNVEAGRLGALTGLVNVYADLGTYWGLTPYIGAGIGFAEKSFRGNYTQTTCIIPACDGQNGTGPRKPVDRADKSVTTFAWGLTAGVSYQLWQGLSVDAAYRYLDLGRAKSGLDAYHQSTRLKDWTAQEFRVGLRYQFGTGVF